MSELERKEVTPEGIAMAEEMLEGGEPILTLGQELRSKFYEYRDARSDIEDD